MAEKTELDSDINTCDAEASSNALVSGTNKNSGNRRGHLEPVESKVEEESKNTIPFYKLFSFADSTDVALMTVGMVAALANGAAMPLMTVFFGQLVNSFGGPSDSNKIVDEVSKVSNH